MSHTLQCKPSQIALTFKHMPGHAGVHTNMVQKALYLCGSKWEKKEQDSTVRKTKEEANSEGNL